ncbi:MAG: potassium transporter TrkG [Bacteroidales bacterium]
MINSKRIANILGLLVIIEGFFILLCLPVAFFYDDGDFSAFLITAGIVFTTGIIIWYFTRDSNGSVGKREGFIIVSLVWVVFSLFGCLPFWISGSIPSFSDSFFETISGFTTTGASVIDDIEAMPHGLLFWRSLTQWMGGMGIIVLSLAILPVLGIGGMQLFIAEVPGPTKEKLHPRVKQTAQRLWGIYIVFTVLEILLLLAGGMNLFDSVCHSFTTMATGGYSTKQASIGHFDSAYIHYVITIFMMIAGTNFILSYFAIHLQFNKIWKNEEFRFYLGFILVFSLIISVGLLLTGDNTAEESFRLALFQVVSIMTTTGFVTADYLLWMPLLSVMIFVLMFFGGSAGSTGGGVKIIRVLLIMKNTYLEIKRLIYPNAVIPVKLNHRPVSLHIISNVMAFVFIYILIIVTSVVVISSFGYDMETSFGAAAATLGNIGPGTGMVGPVENYAHFTDFGKWFLSFLMLLGRLELFTILALFAPSFWKK